MKQKEMNKLPKICQKGYDALEKKVTTNDDRIIALAKVCKYQQKQLDLFDRAFERLVKAITIEN